LKTKTAYRLPKNIPTEEPSNIPPEKDEPVQPSASVHIDFATDKAEPNDAVAEAMQKATEADEAAEALKRQLAHLRASEQAQREYAQRMAQQRAQPPTREQKLSMWIQQGLTEEDGRLLREHPEMIDRDDLTRIASEEAEQHHERGTDAHRQATKENFDRHLAHSQAQAAAATQPAPAFFAPRPAPSPEAPDRAAMYAAPVSRREAGGAREPSPRSVRLSALEQEIARGLKISDVEYAQGKLRLAREKATGERQQ
jgi:hypothetical protein